MKQTAGEILNAYYKSHYFGDKALTEKWVWVKLAANFSIPFPNLVRRREIIYLHDLHHILTGYDTDWAGEGEVAAWEIASGFPVGFRTGYLYAPLTLIVGIFLSPSRILKAFRRGIGKKNLCHLNVEKSRLMSMTPEEIKKELDLI